MDLLLSRYHNIEYVMQMAYPEAMALINKAFETITDDKLYMRWIINHANSIGYKEFKDTLINRQKSDNKTEEEILAQVSDIINTFNGR